MSKVLIITEKPSVAREYATILGVKGSGNGVIENDKYAITWCVGHLVEMSYPEKYDIKYKKWNLSDLPFLPEQYKYDVIKNVEQQYNIVNQLMHREDIDKILYAGDSGREGQVIIELIRRLSGIREGIEEKRVWIDSCTEEEILRGIREAKPISEYENLANAGIMRGIEDYAMGINFSRALSVKYGRMLNKAAANEKYAAIAIGRVMTCVLGMVVRREREIRDFSETPFYRIIAGLKRDEAGFSVDWKATETSDYFESPLLYKDNGFKREKDALDFVNDLKQNDSALIKEIKKSIEKKKAPLLFNLAELQAECSKRFKISPEETLKVAQELYERKFTTYPRTDARVLTTAITKELFGNIKGLISYEPVSDYIKQVIDKKLYSKIASTQYTDDKKVTDHYAIIPTGHTNGYDKLSDIQKKIYDLIVRRFISIFYPNAEYQKVNITVNIGKEEFSATVKVMKSPGYLEVMSSQDDNKDKEENKELLDLVSSFKKGDTLEIDDITIKEGKTSPPKRYTSGSMVLAMENAGKLIEDEELRAQIKGAGIGTSATRAGIIDKLVRIGYLKLNPKTQILTPEKFGEMIFEVVLLTMPSMLNPEMTASWEKGLAGVEQGEITISKYRQTLDDYVRRYTENIKKMDLLDVVAKKINPFATGEGFEKEGSSDRHDIGVTCPLCGGQVQTTPFGYGCSNFSTEGCNFAIGIIAKKRLSELEAAELIEKGHLKQVKGFLSKNGKAFNAGLKMEDETDKDGKIRKKISFVFD